MEPRTKIDEMNGAFCDSLLEMAKGFRNQCLNDNLGFAESMPIDHPMKVMGLEIKIIFTFGEEPKDEQNRPGLRIQK